MKNILITGGLGFIGHHLAQKCLEKNARVIILDNLSRQGGAENLLWLKQYAKSSSNLNLIFEKCSIEEEVAMEQVFQKHGPFDEIYHLAAQVAVTTSVKNPKHDFLVNALGTFHLLEATRKYSPQSLFLYTSTNKVYGELEHLSIQEKETSYQFLDLPYGVSEKMNLDFHSPYGCSKGAADQYVRDYHRIYGLKTIVMRQSCIYGTRQLGIEDQGWLAWFTLASLFKKPITLYGNGKQVRDVLFIEDLLDLYERVMDPLYRDVVVGKAYNIGGGPFHLSLLDFLQLLRKNLNLPIPVNYAETRPGDQKIYISDIRLAQQDVNWIPKVHMEEGVQKLVQWALSSKPLLASLGLF